MPPSVVVSISSISFEVVSNGITHPVWSVRRHAGSEDNAALAAQLDERPGRGSRTVPRAVDVQLKQLLELVHGEVQGRLVLRGASIGHHAVEAALLRDNSIESRLDALLFSNVAVLEF